MQGIGGQHRSETNCFSVGRGSSVAPGLAESWILVKPPSHPRSA